MHKLTTHLKQGDLVKVITGNEKGKTAKITHIDTAHHRAYLEGVNLRVRHIKPTQKDPKGSIRQQEAGIHLSNLMLVDPTTQAPTRTGRKKNEKNKLQRYAKKTGNFIS